LNRQLEPEHCAECDSRNVSVSGTKAAYKGRLERLIVHERLIATLASAEQLPKLHQTQLDLSEASLIAD
jgi:hypothetical protein